MKKSLIVPIIVGPTGVGKTTLSLKLAEKLPVEIVSADSRQIYKYMDIGTAKPSKEILAKIPHHCIDICQPNEYFSAGKYSALARQTIADILERGRRPVVVGGSGFYIKALLDGIFEIEAFSEEIRDLLISRAQMDGLKILYEELRRVDPIYAKKISLNDRQRILRALEVYQTTGQPFSFWHEQETQPADFNYFIMGLTMPRAMLCKRIDDRVDEMISRGLIEEVRKLQAIGFSQTLNALNTVGYKEVFQYLNGQLDYQQMVELIKRNSRRYAKRQMTWFRKVKRIEWREIQDENEMVSLADELKKRMESL